MSNQECYPKVVGRGTSGPINRVVDEVLDRRGDTVVVVDVEISFPRKFRVGSELPVFYGLVLRVHETHMPLQSLHDQTGVPCPLPTTYFGTDFVFVVSG